MHVQAMRLSWSNALVGALLAPIGCGPVANPLSDAAVDVRFAIEVAGGGSEPVYVLLSDEADQVGWVRAFRGSEDIFFRERCEIEDCSNLGVVCGAALPMVRMVADRGQAGSIEFIWDGTTSVIDPVEGCERREPAQSGEYTARFCYAHQVSLEGDGDIALAAMGRLVGTICEDLPFDPADPQDIVFRIPRNGASGTVEQASARSLPGRWRGSIGTE